MLGLMGWRGRDGEGRRRRRAVLGLTGCDYPVVFGAFRLRSFLVSLRTACMAQHPDELRFRACSVCSADCLGHHRDGRVRIWLCLQMLTSLYKYHHPYEANRVIQWVDKEKVDFAIDTASYKKGDS